MCLIDTHRELKALADNIDRPFTVTLPPESGTATNWYVCTCCIINSWMCSQLMKTLVLHVTKDGV